MLDGVNVAHYDLGSLRSYFGVVSQEPVVFNGTIRENIRYNSEGVTEEDIRQAAQQANALGFIEKELGNDIQGKVLPGDGLTKSGNGFERQVGAKGSQISGG